MATTVTTTVKPSGGDYTSLANWEAGQQADLVTLDQIRQAECYSMDDVSIPNISGWTTDATRYIRIYTPLSERHSGKWDATKYRITSRWNISLELGAANVLLEGLQCDCTTASEGGWNVILNSTTTVFNVTIRDCIFKMTNTGIGRYGIRGYAGAAGSQLTAYNNVVYDFSTTSSVGVKNESANITLDAYNTTVHNCITGYSRTAGTFNAKNCGAASCTTGFSGTITQTTCSSSSPTFVDEGGDDFHLASSDSVWKDAGTDLSVTFTTDIDGQTRSGTWDIGADEYVAAGGLSIPIAMYHYQHHIGSGV